MQYSYFKVVPDMKILFCHKDQKQKKKYMSVFHLLKLISFLLWFFICKIYFEGVKKSGGKKSIFYSHSHEGNKEIYNKDIFLISGQANWFIYNIHVQYLTL